MQLRFRIIAPLYTPVELPLGCDLLSHSVQSSLTELNLRMQAMADTSGRFCNIAGLTYDSPQYSDIDDDDKNIRLFCWRPQLADNLAVHVFNNHLSVVEADISIDVEREKAGEAGFIKELQEQVQEEAKRQICEIYSSLCQDLARAAEMNRQLIRFKQAGSYNADIAWIARTILLDQQQLQQQAIQVLLRGWLKHTIRPQDADDIISGKQHESLTWLNYVLVDALPLTQDPRSKMMMLAQYYYTAQDNCNSELRQAIDMAFRGGRNHSIERNLSAASTGSRLNQITFNEHLKYLNRRNRDLLERILRGWRYDHLLENSQRMIDVCSARLLEEDHKRRERSSVMTDMLLVSLSFFTVFELSMSLTEFSREMMSRPALDYNDSDRPFFLSLIAEVDVDVMFTLGFGLTLILVIIYRYMKKR